MQLTGSEIVIECLKEQGVDTVFGYPGGAILNIYDELYRHQNEIRHILTSHEQGAAHAADGYARATGKVGVCMATSGPGATNLVTGIATAYMDSVPMVAITCNVGKALLGKDSFQEIDIAGVTVPITKYSFLVKEVDDLADTLRRAFVIAQTGRPGPVLVDIAKNATADKTEYSPVTPKIIARSTEKIDEDVIEQAIKVLRKSQKPMIFVGGGAVIAGADKELQEFVKKVDAPVADTLMGKGAFPGTDDYYVGMLGMHGTKTANLSVAECDTLVVIGSRFSDRVVTGKSEHFAKNATIIQIDVDEAEINKNVIVDMSIVGDIKSVLDIINARMEQMYHKEWIDKVLARKDALPMTYDPSGLTGPYIMEQINAITDDDTVICTEVGQHQMWAAQFIKHNKAKKFITSGGLGTMGFGYGAAIGAQLGCLNDRVIHITGDGSFHMNLNEACTAISQNLPIITVIMNNKVLGMVYQWQTIFYEKRYSNTTPERKTDFVKLAQAFGAQGYRAETPAEFEEAMKKALKASGPVWIDCTISREERVLPMIPANKSVEDMIID